MATLVFSYQIVPNGGTREQALVNGMLYTGSLETAMKHVQRVSAPNVTGQSNLEVILRHIALRGKGISRPASGIAAPEIGDAADFVPQQVAQASL